MKLYYYLLFTLLSLTFCKHGNWAVLVAGSKGYWNYRHQADVYHAYNILIKNGYNKDHIIVFAYDDIAYHQGNPLQGEVFNKGDGTDVYMKTKIDYKGVDVSSKNYLNVIKGNKASMKGIGTGRVLESTSNDNVFMYFSDHGSDGLVAFPDEDDYLLADELLNAFKEMKRKKMYNQLVYFMEACYSGSMFEHLPKDMNIYANTAANPDESSYAYYCGLDAWVRGYDIQTCLGDEYSIRWLEDSDYRKRDKEFTLFKLYGIAKQFTKKSHVMQYGNLTLGETTPVQDFLYTDNSNDNEDKEKKAMLSKGLRVSSRDVKLFYLKSKAERTNMEIDMNEYQDEINQVARSRKIFELFNTELSLPETRDGKPIDYDCLRFSLKVYSNLCGINERDLEFIHSFSIACSLGIKESSIYDTLQDICEKL